MLEDLHISEVEEYKTALLLMVHKIQDEIILIQHIDFVFPKEFYGVVKLTVILLSVLPRVISDLREVLSTNVFILHHYKT